jgi:high-affinity iron transporter
MFSALLMVFREVIEAGLIIGIVLAATRCVAGRGRWIAGGVAGGTAGALVLAYFASNLAEAFSGAGQEVFNAGVLGVAVLMLAWHNIWMARHGRDLSRKFKNLGHDVSNGNRTLLALALVVGIAVLREGMEVVLFLYGIALTATESTNAMLIGGMSGLALGVSLSAATYRGLLKVPTRHLFAVTSWLIALLAAGMTASAIGFLQQADMITSLTTTAWNSSALLNQKSVIGTLLHTLIGYTEQPTQAQLLAYIFALVTIFGLMRLFAPHYNVAATATNNAAQN